MDGIPMMQWICGISDMKFNSCMLLRRLSEYLGYLEDYGVVL